MLTERFPILSGKRKSLFSIQRRFAYYRFHKRVGKGSWVKYIERYQLPRSIENTQRLVFNYRPTFSEKKLSCSWLWNLPKKIALATTTDEVLNVWAYYRHKRKKAYHFLQVLKRLVELGNCSTTDWRFQLITSRIENKINTFLNLPRICFYLGRLKATATLQDITKMLKCRLHGYLPHQLLLILKGFACCHLQDKHLFNQIRDILKPQVETLSFYYLSSIIESYSCCLIHDYMFLNFLANEIIYRIDLCVGKKGKEIDMFTIRQWKFANGEVIENSSRTESEEEDDGIFISDRSVVLEEKSEEEQETFKREMRNLQKEEEMLITYKQEQLQYYPTIKNLIDIAEYFSILKFQNFLFYDYISALIIHMLKYKNCLNPYLLEKSVLSFHKIKINDIKLFEHILKHIEIYVYEYPPSVLCSIGYVFASLLPCYYSPIYKIMKKMILYIKGHIDILGLDNLSKLACFVHKMKNMDKTLRKEIFVEINEQLKKKENKNCRSVYDISRLLETLSFHNLPDATVFFTLCNHLISHLKHFEPSDFCRTVRALYNIKQHCNLCDSNIMNSIAREVIKQRDVFHTIDYHKIAKMVLDMNVIKDIYKIDLIKYHNNTPFYNFDELELKHEMPKEEKPSLYRYKKGTIYYRQKKALQQYPLYKSVED